MKILRIIKIVALWVSMLLPFDTIHGQVAVKTNLAGWSTTTCNIGTELSISNQSTIQLVGALNPWSFSGEKRLRIWSIMPEYRWWPCQSFNGHFFGIHTMGGEFNVKNIDLPLGILPKTKRGRHYEGWYVGGGVTYGYQWMLSRHWNFEASIGLGYDYINYKLYGQCDRILEDTHRNYWGVTKLALSAIYLF